MNDKCTSGKTNIHMKFYKRQTPEKEKLLVDLSFATERFQWQKPYLNLKLIKSSSYA